MTSASLLLSREAVVDEEDDAWGEMATCNGDSDFRMLASSWQYGTVVVDCDESRLCGTMLVDGVKAATLDRCLKKTFQQKRLHRMDRTNRILPRSSLVGYRNDEVLCPLAQFGFVDERPIEQQLREREKQTAQWPDPSVGLVMTMLKKATTTTEVRRFFFWGGFSC
eukprot:scaffold1485_cov171-Amphora_coffeaeformis.AAC.9